MRVDPILSDLMRELSSRGFDLCGLASARRHDRGVPTPRQLLSTAVGDRLVVVVGHSRGWWDRCLDTLVEEPALLDSLDPIDEVAERMVEAAVRVSAPAESLPDGAWEVRYAHAQHPPSMRDLAAQAGLASFGPAGLGAHARWGPWISFRAAIVTTWPAPTAGETSSGPCEGCRGPCGPAMEEARRAAPIPAGATRLPLAGWRAYADARAICPVGTDARYGADQLEYHYTHGRDVLRRALAQRRRCSSKKSKTRSSI